MALALAAHALGSMQGDAEVSTLPGSAQRDSVISILTLSAPPTSPPAGARPARPASSGGVSVTSDVSEAEHMSMADWM